MLSREAAAAALGAAAAAAAVALWLRRAPPWSLAPAMHPEVRRSAWDAVCRRVDRRGRLQRRRLRLYLIRHGESEANLQLARVVGGRQTGSPLTPLGERQAQLLGRRLAADGVRFDRVLASHAARARQTAELACAELGVAPAEIEIDPRAVEFSQGANELQPRAEVYREGGPTLRGIARHGELFFRPPGLSPDGDRGESQWDAEQRMSALVGDLLRRADAGDDGTVHVALFSHGVAIRALVRAMIGAGMHFVSRTATENTSITEVRYEPAAGDQGGWHLVRLNDAAHLRAPEAKCC